MAHFYGWTHDYINGLDYADAIEYYEAITVIEGQKYLVEMNVNDYAKMKKDDRNKFYREMRKNAYPKGMQKETTFDEFIRKMTNG